jgi:hypothetical protein
MNQILKTRTKSIFSSVSGDLGELLTGSRPLFFTLCQERTDGSGQLKHTPDPIHAISFLLLLFSLLLLGLWGGQPHLFGKHRFYLVDICRFCLVV